MLNSNSFNNVNIVGKNILKDENEINTLDLFTNTFPSEYYDNSILNSNLNNENIIK